MENDKTKDIPSPCIKQCEMDFNSGLCKACNRTIKEITDWGMLTNEQKLNILKLIKRRKQKD